MVHVALGLWFWCAAASVVAGLFILVLSPPFALLQVAEPAGDEIRDGEQACLWVALVHVALDLWFWYWCAWIGCGWSRRSCRTCAHMSCSKLGSSPGDWAIGIDCQCRREAGPTCSTTTGQASNVRLSACFSANH